MNRIAIVDRPPDRRPVRRWRRLSPRRRSRRPPTIPRRRRCRRRRSRRARRSAASSSPLPAGSAPSSTAPRSTSEAEAQLFADATQDRLGPLRQDQGRQARRRCRDQAGRAGTIKGRLDSVAPGTEGDWVVDRRRGRAHRRQQHADPRRGRLPRRQGAERHALQGGRRAALPPLRQVAGLAPGRGRQSLRRHAGDVRSWSTKSRSRRSPCRPSRSAADVSRSTARDELARSRRARAARRVRSRRGRCGP